MLTSVFSDSGKLFIAFVIILCHYKKQYFYGSGIITKTWCSHIDTENCVLYLAEARAAYHNLILGNRVQTITHNGRTVTYTNTPNSLANLQRYITELEYICGGNGCRRSPARAYFGDRTTRAN